MVGYGRTEKNIYIFLVTHLSPTSSRMVEHTEHVLHKFVVESNEFIFCRKYCLTLWLTCNEILLKKLPSAFHLCCYHLSDRCKKQDLVIWLTGWVIGPLSNYVLLNRGTYQAKCKLLFNYNLKDSPLRDSKCGRGI